MFNPFYGKRGIGYLKNPKKAIRSAIYRSLTIGTSPSDINRALKRNSARARSANHLSRTKTYNSRKKQLSKKEVERIKTQILSNSAKVRRSLMLDEKGENHYNYILETGKLTKNKKAKSVKTTFGKVIIFIIVLLLLVYVAQISNRQAAQEPSLAPHSDSSHTNDNSELHSDAIVDTNTTNDNLVEGSKYDPICKKSISEKFGVAISAIHYTGTQNEDSKMGKYVMSDLNYGKVYRGEAIWLCKVFIHEDGKISTIIFDL